MPLTFVTGTGRIFRTIRRVLWLAFWPTVSLLAVSSSQIGACAQMPTPGPGAALYRSLRESGLDLTKVYRVRDATFDREELHFTLNDGWLIEGQEVAGHVTAAFFIGDGEILLIPPNARERSSLGLFLNAAVLEEGFTSAYFRFFDDQFLHDLEPAMRAGENPDILANANSSAKELSRGDALRLLLAYLNKPAESARSPRYLHARVVGNVHGAFDIFYDEGAPEQISIGKIAFAPGGLPFFNVWTSFPSRSHREEAPSATVGLPLLPKAFHVKANVHPPESLDGDAEVELQVLQPESRAVIFELSRALKVSQVTMNGNAIEFLQNEAVEGSRIAREGNDYVAVILPAGLMRGQSLKLHFLYSGTVLADAGNGLLYVGARGNWYPNLGLNMAMFDLEFRCPSDWTLVATGKRTEFQKAGGEQTSRWISQRPVPVAGFNLGHYQESEVFAGAIPVDCYSAEGVERSFPVTTQSVTQVVPGKPQRELQVTAPPPLPTGELPAREAAATIDYLGARIGPYPFSSLSLTQMPGSLSQGWPGLVYLSSFVFVPQASRGAGANSPYDQVLFDRLMVAHETAHQWWGDSVYWTTYRDKWISEAMANYSAMLSFERESPKSFKTVLDFYRAHLAEKDPEGKPTREAGPVTLGHRLNSSVFPNGWELIAYGRGTWLIHMLREFFRDGQQGASADPDVLFLSVLRQLQSDYAGKQMSTEDMQHAFERLLPKSLYFEGKPSLAWFFDGWVNGTAQPRYELASVRFDRKGPHQRVSAKLLQKNAPEELVTAVPIYAEITKGDLRFLARVFADGAETDFSLNVPAGTRRLVIDPNGTLLTAP